MADVAERLNASGIEWMLVGSAATALRGAAIVPADIDIAVHTAAEVSDAATVLPTPAGPPARPDDPAGWFSTAAEPSIRFDHAGEHWTFGKWIIDEVKVELAHIDAPAAAALMMETRSTLVWNERETLTCLGQPIPTVPIEAQLATMIARQQDSRIRAAIAAIDPAQLDVTLLRRAISDRRSEVPGLAIPLSIQHLLAEGQAAID
ncbi:hypothetical protein AB0P21_29785 [Kribbella sp. NPDC056861]|uniref:hypothetical protein n=1 Tax=Kribbella sp. NPDC056861 TaxID=3154857 RepID=UPI003449984D